MSRMIVTTDFRLYHSNALDVLAGLLAETLRSPVPGQSLLVPDTILIPQAAMRRWLQATLATTHGVVANLEFLTPGEFVARALDANLGAVPNALDTAVLHWRLYAALCDPALLTEPALAELHAYLADGDLFKPWTLAEALSAAFEKYQAWRCDWLLRWEAGADPDDPQAILWRHSVNGATHRARRIHDYLNRYGSGTAPPKDCQRDSLFSPPSTSLQMYYVSWRPRHRLAHCTFTCRPRPKNIGVMRNPSRNACISPPTASPRPEKTAYSMPGVLPGVIS